MEINNIEKIKEEIWQFIQEMNRLWTSDGKAEELKNYFHEKMIVLNPMDKFRLEGSERCVQGWVNFAKTAVIHYWNEKDPEIVVYNNGTVAVVTYYYDMSYEMNERTIKSEGRDLFFLVKENNRWWIVADEFSEYPK
jgi:hypothetical protein